MPVLDSNLFSPVVNAQQPNLPFEQIVTPVQKWHQFADFMRNLKKVLISQVNYWVDLNQF